MDALKRAGIRVVTPAFADLEHTVREELARALSVCQTNNLKLILHEVGGYAIKALHEHFAEACETVIGAIEVTKQGVWAAQSLPELRIPQVNCAQTRLKEIEGKMVGEAVVSSLDNILRDMGYAVVGRAALVNGYGWVGKATANSLRQRGLRVSVNDCDIIKCVEATVDGFAVVRQPSDIESPAIVIGASGRESISAQVIDNLPDRCFIVSGASKNHEADLDHLASLTVRTRPIHRHVDAHTLKDGRTLLLVNKGYPVNFTGSSVPDEIVEFLFAELIMLVPALLDHDLEPGIYPLKDEHEQIAAQIWLDLR
ncbi:MAG: hypothetical protein JKY37_24805 [Nannocystaceae bacterium]|nr:hypothetical protein [Nannocystaceae bacterium]